MLKATTASETIGLPGLAVVVLIVAAGLTYGLLDDPDEDGLLNYEEMRWRTDPFHWDSDRDSLSDGNEIHALATGPTSPNPRVAQVAPYLEGYPSDAARELTNMLEDNPPHNIAPQILASGVYLDGEVTPAEVAQMQDGDRDGLIRMLEEEVGTDPGNPDTDKDGLPDGWEYAEGVRIRDNYVPLNGSDPLHKDIHLLILPIDGNLSSQLGENAPENATPLSAAEARQELVDRYADANVTNPDGERGITLHISRQTHDLERYRDSRIGTEYSTADTEDPTVSTVNPREPHPFLGAYYFTRLVEIEEDGLRGWADAPGFNSAVDPDSSSKSGYRPHTTADHELVHNIVGELDPEIQRDGDSIHPRPSYGRLDVTNENVTSEISRDGILGLPRVSSTDDFQGWHPSLWEMVAEGKYSRNSDA